MKIAIPCADGQLCMHFGHCQQFTFVETNADHSISSSEALEPPPHEPGVYPKWVREQGAEVVIAGGMGMRAQQLFTDEGIQVVTGACAGKPEEIVAAYLAGTLATGENACDH